jgi:hypothetical protein
MATASKPVLCRGRNTAAQAARAEFRRAQNAKPQSRCVYQISQRTEMKDKRGPAAGAWQRAVVRKQLSRRPPCPSQAVQPSARDASYCAAANNSTPQAVFHLITFTGLQG